MEKMTDEQMQQMLEQDLWDIPAEDNDLQTYKTLFDYLKKEEQNGLPFNFSAKVNARIRLEKDMRFNLKFMLVTAAVILLALGVLCSTLFLIKKTYFNDVMAFASNNPGIIAVTLIALIAYHYFGIQLNLKRKLTDI